jgi:hypothetical protein
MRNQEKLKGTCYTEFGFVPFSTDTADLILVDVLPTPFSSAHSCMDKGCTAYRAPSM